MRNMACAVLLGSLVAMAVCGGLVWGDGNAAGVASQPSAGTGTIALQMAVIVDANEPTLLLTVTNTGKDTVTIPDFMEQGNAVKLIEPGGTGGEVVGLGGKPIAVELGAGASKSWEFAVGGYFGRAGTYRLTWRVGRTQTAEIVYVRKADDPRWLKPPPKVE